MVATDKLEQNALQRAHDILRVEDLRTYFYTKEGAAKAVDGVSFSVSSGEIFGLVGESGSGKTMTLKSILRLVTPPGRIIGGHIYYRGEDVLAWPPSKLSGFRGSEIAMIFQEPMTALDPVLRVGAQIVETLQEHRRMAHKEARDQAAELLRLVGMPSPARRLDEYPHQYSGGMRQRAMIAIALSCNPKVLLADEPTTAIDVTLQDQILDLVLQLQEQLHMTVIWVTHDFGVIAMICKRVGVMYAGRLLEVGEVSELLSEPRHPYTLGLLESIPRADRRRELLVPIPGAPPDVRSLPSGCAFYSRCRFAADECREAAAAPLHHLSHSHASACVRVRDIWK